MKKLLIENFCYVVGLETDKKINNEIYASINPTEHIIAISNTLNKDDRMLNFLHEILHAIFCHSNLRLSKEVEELLIIRISRALTVFFTQNNFDKPFRDFCKDLIPFEFEDMHKNATKIIAEYNKIV